jgi:hypothetical protein
VEIDVAVAAEARRQHPDRRGVRQPSARARAGIPSGRWRQAIVGVVAVVDRQALLLEIVLTLCPRGHRTDLLHSRQQQADEHGDDGDHHQQLNQRECGSESRVLGFIALSFDFEQPNLQSEVYSLSLLDGP